MKTSINLFMVFLFAMFVVFVGFKPIKKGLYINQHYMDMVTVGYDKTLRSICTKQFNPHLTLDLVKARASPTKGNFFLTYFLTFN